MTNSKNRNVIAKGASLDKMDIFRRVAAQRRQMRVIGTLHLPSSVRKTKGSATSRPSDQPVGLNAESGDS
jgi:hypothetical protein